MHPPCNVGEKHITMQGAFRGSVMYLMNEVGMIEDSSEYVPSFLPVCAEENVTAMRFTCHGGGISFNVAIVIFVATTAARVTRAVWTRECLTRFSLFHLANIFHVSSV
jgi:hypothetical protein